MEPNANQYSNLVKNRPHAHRVSFAASCSEEEAAAKKTGGFYNVGWSNAAQVDGVDSVYKQENRAKIVHVPCGSLTPVLQSLFGGHISFFSLDVEGAEPLVLKNLDFNELFIEVFIVENRNNACKEECASRDEFRQILHDRGYKRWNKVIIYSDLYVHPDSKLLKLVPSNPDDKVQASKQIKPSMGIEWSFDFSPS